ncbi:MAG: hypothetical protein ACI4SO_06300 [Muribaculaceae bacterium]
MIFDIAYSAWENCRDLRARRKRNKDFTYGRQWGDVIYDPVTKGYMAEESIAMRTGRQPLTNNLIRKLVKTIIGRYRAIRNVASEEKSEELKELYRLNHLDELDCRLLEEFLISGCAIQRVTVECRREGKVETFVDNVSPGDFFINTVKDPRGWDVQLTGMLHDMSLAEVVMRYAHGDRKRAADIRKIYGECNMTYGVNEPLGMGDVSDNEFFVSPTGRCRVIEVWTLESCETLRCHDYRTGEYYECPAAQESEINAENARRQEKGLKPIEVLWNITTEWRCRIYAPNGEEIDSFVSPYAHGNHPFVVKLYPLIDGEVHSFVEDVIPQQKHINRLITLIDTIMSVSSKGALLFPVQSKPDGLDWEDFRQNWAACGGIIPYSAKAGIPAPHQETASGLDAGASRLLEVQLQMIQDVSGVNNTLYGGELGGNVGIERYERQIQNASVTISDILETFCDLLKQRDEKAMTVK